LSRTELGPPVTKIESLRAVQSACHQAGTRLPRAVRPDYDRV